MGAQTSECVITAQSGTGFWITEQRDGNEKKKKRSDVSGEKTYLLPCTVFAFCFCLVMTWLFDLPARHLVVKHNKAFVCMCVLSSNITGCLKPGGESHCSKRKKKKWRLSTNLHIHTRHPPSARLIHTAPVHPVFCVDVVDGVGGYLTMSPTYCCRPLTQQRQTRPVIFKLL